jgi:hypothetical protein
MPGATQILDDHCRSVARETCKSRIMFGEREPSCKALWDECEFFDRTLVEAARGKAHLTLVEWSRKAKCLGHPQFNSFYGKLEVCLRTLPLAKAGPRKHKPHRPPIRNGTYTGYRGVEDSLDILRGRGGFGRWPAGERTLEASGGVVGWLQKITAEKKNTASFIEYCVRAKDRSRPTISTTINDSCGGYDGGYIYKFDLPNVVQVPMPDILLGAGWEDSFRFMMYLEAGKTVEKSSIVGINLDVETTEVVFLTPIPIKHITQYRDARSG